MKRRRPTRSSRPRRRLASVAAAIVRLAVAPAPPAPAPPLVPTPRCTSTPTCEERGVAPVCVYCRIRAHGPLWWLTPREAGGRAR